MDNIEVGTRGKASAYRAATLEYIQSTSGQAGHGYLVAVKRTRRLRRHGALRVQRGRGI